MANYVPGTGSPENLGRTYIQVFAPNVAGLLKWLWLIGIGFSVLSWIGGTLDSLFWPQLAFWFFLCGAGQVSVLIYTAGIARGIGYAQTEMRRNNDPEGRAL